MEVDMEPAFEDIMPVVKEVTEKKAIRTSKPPIQLPRHTDVLHMSLEDYAKMRNRTYIKKSYGHRVGTGRGRLAAGQRARVRGTRGRGGFAGTSGFRRDYNTTSDGSSNSTEIPDYEDLDFPVTTRSPSPVKYGGGQVRNGRQFGRSHFNKDAGKRDFTFGNNGGRDLDQSGTSKLPSSELAILTKQKTTITFLNLGPAVKEDELKTLCEVHGAVAYCQIVTDARGIRVGVVDVICRTAANKIVSEYNGVKLDDYPMQVYIHDQNGFSNKSSATSLTDRLSYPFAHQRPYPNSRGTFNGPKRFQSRRERFAGRNQFPLAKKQKREVPSREELDRELDAFVNLKTEE